MAAEAEAAREARAKVMAVMKLLRMMMKIMKLLRMMMKKTIKDEGFVKNKIGINA